MAEAPSRQVNGVWTPLHGGGGYLHGASRFLHGGRAMTHVNKVYLGEGSFPPCKQGLAGGRELSPM